MADALYGLNLPHVAAMIFNTPLMIATAKLDAIVSGLGSRFGISAVDGPGLYTTDRGDVRRAGYRVAAGNVGVIDVFGVLAHRGSLKADSSYVLGYQEVSRMLSAALADPDVEGILLNLDTPGGSSSGAFDMADQIRAASAVKPVWAAIGDSALSAGYLMASGAQRIGITQTGAAGSIGVVIRHVDMSAALAKEGVSVTHVYAGAHKVDGSPTAPLPDEVRAEYQRQVDGLYQLFVAHVASGRGLSADDVKSTEAAIYTGAEAVARGLADVIATPDQMISELSAFARKSRNTKARATATSTTPGANMSKQETGLAAPESFSAAQLDAARAEGHAAGLAAGLERGAEQERERIKSVEGQMLPGHEALIASLKFDGKTTGPEAAVKVLSAEREKMSEYRAKFSADAPAPVPFAAAPVDSSGQGASLADASVEDRTKSQWDADASLRADFGGEYSRFLAFSKAQERGLIKIYSGKGE